MQPDNRRARFCFKSLDDLSQTRKLQSGSGGRQPAEKQKIAARISLGFHCLPDSRDLIFHKTSFSRRLTSRRNFLLFPPCACFIQLSFPSIICLLGKIIEISELQKKS